MNSSEPIFNNPILGLEDSSSDLTNAVKISRDNLAIYEQIAQNHEKECLIVSPFFVELDEGGEIRKMRDKIREKGITFKLNN